jgi:hypothetical protein
MQYYVDIFALFVENRCLNQRKYRSVGSLYQRGGPEHAHFGGKTLHAMEAPYLNLQFLRVNIMLIVVLVPAGDKQYSGDRALIS